MVPNGNHDSAAIEGLELKVTSSGSKKGTLSNAHQTHFFQYRMIIDKELNEDNQWRGDITFNVNYDEINLYQRVKVEKFLFAFSKGGNLIHEYTETGETSKYFIAPGTFSPLHPYLIKVLEDLLLIEQTLKTSFNLPEEFTEEEEKNITDLAYSIKTGKASGTVDMSFDLERKTIEGLLNRNGSISMNEYIYLPSKILGKEVSLGYAWVECNKFVIKESDKKQVNELLQDSPEQKIFSIVLESPASFYFPDFLSPEEFEKLHQNESFRHTSLNHLIAFLFGISSDKNRLVDFDALIKIFELASKHKTESGKPFNMLMRCSAQEFTEAIKPVLPYYKNFELPNFLLKLNEIGILSEDGLNYCLKEINVNNA